MTRHYLDYSFTNTASLERKAKVLDLLKKPHTRAELAKATGIGVNGMHAYLLALKGEKLIHVSGWRRNSPGSPSPIYMVGNKRNAPKPRPVTNAEKTRKWRDNNPERVIQDIHKKRMARAVLQVDPITAALFGQS